MIDNLKLIIKWYFNNKLIYFFCFCFPFLVLFSLTHKGNDIRALKCICFTLVFALFFSIFSKNKYEIILPLLCPLLFYIGTAGTFTLYTESLNVGWREIQYELFFSESLSCILLLLSRIEKYYVVSLLEILLIIISLIYIGYYIFFDISINADAFFIILQTNSIEVYNFLIYNLTFTISAMLISVFIFAKVVIYNQKNKECSKEFSKECRYINKILDNKIGLSTLLVIFIAMEYYVVFRGEHLYIHRDFSIATGYFKQVRLLSENKVNLKKIKSNNGIKNIVLIIGESACRDYMGCYGYSRNNTPWMSSKKDDNNFIFFDKVYSSYRMTNKSLAYFLTEKSQYNDKEIYSSMNFIDILNAADYDTYWISRQGNVSNYREIYNVIAQRSKYLKFIENGKYDEELLNLLDIPVDNSRKFIVIHLGGSHHPYKGFTPKYNIYKNNDINDNYDNTIIYTDYVVEKIFSKLKAHDIDLFIYTSDHGESKDMLRTKFDFRMSHIPFVVYFSDRFIKNNKEQYSMAKIREHTYFTSDMFYDTILNLLNIDEGLYIKEQSLFSKDYKFDKNNLKTEYGDIYIKEDPYDY